MGKIGGLDTRTHSYIERGGVPEKRSDVWSLFLEQECRNIIRILSCAGSWLGFPSGARVRSVTDAASFVTRSSAPPFSVASVTSAIMVPIRVDVSFAVTRGCQTRTTVKSVCSRKKTATDARKSLTSELPEWIYFTNVRNTACNTRTSPNEAYSQQQQQK